jgi:hypothetical protein
MQPAESVPPTLAVGALTRTCGSRAKCLPHGCAGASTASARVPVAHHAHAAASRNWTRPRPLRPTASSPGMAPALAAQAHFEPADNALSARALSLPPLGDRDSQAGPLPYRKTPMPCIKQQEQLNILRSPPRPAPAWNAVPTPCLLSPGGCEPVGAARVGDQHATHIVSARSLTMHDESKWTRRMTST